jgi:hypothetical protein
VGHKGTYFIFLALQDCLPENDVIGHGSKIKNKIVKKAKIGRLKVAYLVITCMKQNTTIFIAESGQGIKIWKIFL